ncbi:hypothetical protein F5887DRAFT_1175533 [Amanita rubescens]|nr:hypothetical protein F5887DRAFT_1175533 [Amanita rubescens]
MPSQDSHLDAERDRDRDKERDYEPDRADRALSKQKPSSAQKSALLLLSFYISPHTLLIAKDLSHVPCKFFKVGACTAGSSCPFSHVVPEPGQKEACAWFVKGNCKFGHKCALAHILPGQSMAMDRKNKKAAQAAAAAATAAEKGILGPKDGSKDATARGTVARKRDGHLSTSVAGHTGPHGNGSAAHGGSGRNALLTGGSTAPTRILSSSSASTPSTRPPINMPLKAPISPSAPAPSLKDTDFASFAAIDEMEGVDLPAPQGQGKTDHETKEEQEYGNPPSDAGTSDLARVADVGQPRRESQPPSPVHLPTSAPRPSAPPAMTNFGPIGSPPSATRTNGLLASRKVPGTISPGTSPRSNSGANFLHPNINHAELSLSPPSVSNAGPQPFLPSSPFSAPGAQSVFLSSSLSTRGDTGANLGFMSGVSGRDNSGPSAFNMGGMAASLGTGMALLGGNGDGFDDYAVGISKTSRMGRINAAAEQAVVDEDLEEFIPSSLSDLLTPEERRRRMSRSGQQKPQVQPQVPGVPMPATRPPVAGDSSSPGAQLGHRYSRSVPAPSLLGDLKSIWSDTGANSQKGVAVASDRNEITALPTFTNKPVLNGGSNLLTDDMGLSMSMGSSSSIGTHMNVGLSPSNASAAFLPSFHHHYLKAKQQNQVGLLSTGSVAAAGNRNGPGVANLTRGVRTPSGPLFSGVGASNNTPIPGNVGVHTHGGTVHTYRTTPSPFDLTQPQHQHHSATNRGPGAFGTGVDDPLANNQYLSSPGARALQAHAPGQSLPQGLAAGLSRIHALPPLPSLTSPGTSVNTDVDGGVPTSGPYGEWKGPASPAPNMIGGNYIPFATGAVGQTSMLNHNGDTSLSRMSYSTVARVGGSIVGGNNPSPPGLSRGSSSAGRYPLAYGEPSRPTDDDELFTMDG